MSIFSESVFTFHFKLRIFVLTSGFMSSSLLKYWFSSLLLLTNSRKFMLAPLKISLDLWYFLIPSLTVSAVYKILST